MKLKIRGLVFAGFAAAVFAQSASATVDDSDKTVTSKTYVDSKIQGTVNNATTINASSPDTKAPSELNVYKFVENRIISSGGGIDGNINKHTQKVGYLDSTWAATANTGLSSPFMVTSADLEAHPTWTEHVTRWELIVPDSVVAESGSDIGGTVQNPGPASGHGSDLTTAQAVYDFVNGTGNGDGFQPKTHVENGQDSSTLKVGTGEGEWSVLQAYDDNATGNDDTGYITISHSTTRGVYEINLDGSQIARYGAAGTDSGGSYSNQIEANSMKLATANAVYQYAVKQDWGSQHEGKHLVINSSGMVDLSDTASPDIPVPTNSNCAQTGGTAVCALVAYWDATLNDGDGGVKYEWTVMAGTGS